MEHDNENNFDDATVCHSHNTMLIEGFILLLDEEEVLVCTYQQAVSHNWLVP